MAIKITSTGRTTFVKEIKIGAPITSVKETQGIFLTTGRSEGNILIYDSAEGFYKSGPLVGGTGIQVAHSTDSDKLTLTNTLYPASLSFDDGNGEITLNRADGSQLTVQIGFGAFTTSDLTEGSNLYYTDARARASLTQGNQIEYNSTLGVISVKESPTFTDLTLTGDLTVQGNTTTLSTSELTVEDINITIAQGAADSATADGAGLTIDGANATLLYDHANSKWKINRGLIVNGDLLPASDSVYDLGSSLFKWKDLHLSGNTIFLGGLKIKDSATQLLITDSVDAVVEFNLSGSQDQIRGFFGAEGDLSYNSSTGIFSFDVEQVYTKANFDSDLGAALNGGTGITYDSSTDTISITNTNVTAGTYGSASEVPVFTVNSQGQLDSAGTVSVAGVSATSIDSSTGAFTINTADGGSFTTRLYDADILNNDGNKAGITWTVSGATNQFRTATNYIDSDLEVYTIREMNFTNNKLRIEVAQFSPVLTATGQTNLNFDQKSTQFSVSIDNPSDFTTRFINSVSGIAQTDAYVGTTLGDYNAGSKSQTPAGGVDWTQVFTFDSVSGAAVRDNSTTIVGGTSIGEITFADDQGANFGTTASFTTTWKTPNVSISMSNLSGNQFLETYSSTSYTVGVTNMSSSSNYTHTVTPTGGSVSDTTGSGTFTFTTPIHKDNGGGRTLALSTELRRPPGVATTSYAVTDTASDTSLNANFTYPSLTIFTAGSGTPPTRGDVINGDQFESAVTELSDQTKTFAQTVNNSDSVPKCFWFMVRSAASQPTTFQTGASSSLLSDVSTTTGTLDLEPDSPPAGYNSETYNLYGIILQPGNTFVSIS